MSTLSVGKTIATEKKDTALPAKTPGFPVFVRSHKRNAINVQAEEARINAQDNSTITFTSKEIKNAIFTLNTNAAIYATGFISSIDLVMNNGNFYGKNCVSNSMAINVGAGLSKVETKTLESISVNTAVGDCEVYYFGANPTITKTNITGNLIIKNGEEG